MIGRGHAHDVMAGDASSIHVLSSIHAGAYIIVFYELETIKIRASLIFDDLPRTEDDVLHYSAGVGGCTCCGGDTRCRR